LNLANSTRKYRKITVYTTLLLYKKIQKWSNVRENETISLKEKRRSHGYLTRIKYSRVTQFLSKSYKSALYTEIQYFSKLSTWVAWLETSEKFSTIYGNIALNTECETYDCLHLNRHFLKNISIWFDFFVKIKYSTTITVDKSTSLQKFY